MTLPKNNLTPPPLPKKMGNRLIGRTRGFGPRCEGSSPSSPTIRNMKLVVYHDNKIFHHTISRSVKFDIEKSEMLFNNKHRYRSILKFPEPQDVLDFVEIADRQYPEFEIVGESDD